RAIVVLELRDVAHFDAPPASAARGGASGARGALPRSRGNQEVAHHQRVPIGLVEAQQDLELIVAVLELRHFLAADERAQVVRERVDVDAKVGGARPVDVDAQFGLSRLEVGVDVDDARDLANLRHQVDGVDLKLLDVRPLNEDVEAVEAAATAARTTAAAAAATAATGGAGD